MECAEFDPILEIPCEECGMIGKFFYIQKFIVGSVDYRMLFMPLIADTTSSRARLEADLGSLSDNIYEVKFVLGLDFENPSGFQFATPKDLGMKPLFRRGMESLGERLVESMVHFGKKIPCDGFVAIALDDKPKLNLYYSRLLESHASDLKQSGYEAKCCLGGQGYALFRTRIEIPSERSASAEA